MPNGPGAIGQARPENRGMVWRTATVLVRAVWKGRNRDRQVPEISGCGFCLDDFLGNSGIARSDFGHGAFFESQGTATHQVSGAMGTKN